jgi:hypothetical protein
MSWQIQAERMADRDFQVDVRSLVEDLEKQMPETGHSEKALQAEAAISAAENILNRVRTQYPLGCLVRVVCDGHAPNETLNYHPSHVNVRVMVEPVKISR